MAIIHRLSTEEIQRYTHYGLFCGVCPIYVSPYEPGCPLAVRNWVPEWLLDVTHGLFEIFATTSGNEDAPFQIKLTGEIRAR